MKLIKLFNVNNNYVVDKKVHIRSIYWNRIPKNSYFSYIENSYLLKTFHNTES